MMGLLDPAASIFVNVFAFLILGLIGIGIGGRRAAVRPTRQIGLWGFISGVLLHLLAVYTIHTSAAFPGARVVGWDFDGGSLAVHLGIPIALAVLVAGVVDFRLHPKRPRAMSIASTVVFFGSAEAVLYQAWSLPIRVQWALDRLHP